MHLISTLFSLTLRAALVLLGLVFFASVLLTALLLLAFWLVRAGWGRLTGRSVPRWTFHVASRDRWNRFYRASNRWTGPPGGGATAADAGDVIDVQAKEAGSAGAGPPTLR